jgi:hypothetical protein
VKNFTRDFFRILVFQGEGRTIRNLHALGSAGFQVCRVAGFQTGTAIEGLAPGRPGSRRNSRFGNLRYE